MSFTSLLRVSDQMPGYLAVIYTHKPDEMGSYDPILSAFTPTQFLGTTNNTACVTGYDQTAFITGTSSALFNEYNSSVGLVHATSKLDF